MYHSLFTTYNNGTSCKKRTCSYRSAQPDNWFDNNNTLWNQKAIYYMSDFNEGWKVNIWRSHWSFFMFSLLVHFSAQLDEFVRDCYHKSGVTMKCRLYILYGNDFLLYSDVSQIWTAHFSKWKTAWWQKAAARPVSHLFCHSVAYHTVSLLCLQHLITWLLHLITCTQNRYADYVKLRKCV